jgi:hypothetical protein
MMAMLSQPARAQADPRQILGQVIIQLQTGTPNPMWYGPQLWQTIAAQTSNTGVYIQLVRLGRVNNIVITQQVPLPTGMLYSIVAQHQNGISTWILGISSVTNRIEYANFVIGGAPQVLPYPNNPQTGYTPQQSAPQFAPQDAPPQTPNPPPNPAPPQGSASDSCRKFPNLC